MEDFIVQVIGQALAVFFSHKIIGEKGDPPCAAFSGGLHDIYRGIDGSGKDALSHAFCLKEPAMSHHAVQFHILFLQKDIHSCLQRAKGCIEVDTHEIGKIEAALRRAYKERSSFVKSGDMLAREIIVCEQSAAVFVAFQRLIVKRGKQPVHVHVHPK